MNGASSKLEQRWRRPELSLAVVMVNDSGDEARRRRTKEERLTGKK